MEEVEEKQPPTVLTSDTDNQTTISPDEAPPGKREKYRKFRAYNTGMWNGSQRENTEEFRRQDDLHRYDAISSKLGLTDYQQARGRRLIDKISLSDMSLDEAAFAICVVVVNNDIEGTRYWPNHGGETMSHDELFEEIADSLGISLPRQTAIVQKVYHWVDS